jgi:hypothetical protein
MIGIDYALFAGERSTSNITYGAGAPLSLPVPRSLRPPGSMSIGKTGISLFRHAIDVTSKLRRVQQSGVALEAGWSRRAVSASAMP